MARRLDDASFERADAHCVALAHRFVDMSNALRLGARRDDAAFVRCFELADAGGVVGMMMGHQNLGKPPAGLFQRGLDRSGFRRIDRCGGAACRVVDENAEIILQAGEQVGLDSHVIFSIRRAR